MGETGPGEGVALVFGVIFLERIDLKDVLDSGPLPFVARVTRGAAPFHGSAGIAEGAIVYGLVAEVTDLGNHYLAALEITGLRTPDRTILPLRTDRQVLTVRARPRKGRVAGIARAIAGGLQCPGQGLQGGVVASAAETATLGAGEAVLAAGMKVSFRQTDSPEIEADDPSGR